MDGNGFQSMGSEREKRELRRIAEFFNRIELDEDIDVTTRELLQPWIQECADAIYANPPDLSKARRAMAIASIILERSGGT